MVVFSFEEVTVAVLGLADFIYQIEMAKIATLLPMCVLAEKCLKHYQLEEWANQSIENGFCLADAGRTCCGANDALKVRAEVEYIRQSPGVTSECLELLSRTRCSYCDPDIGTGKSKGLCLNYCDKLWTVCGNQIMIDPYIDPLREVPVCRDNSILCHQASSFVADGF